MQEVYTIDDDNLELGIADYYRYFPRETGDQDDPDPGQDDGNGNGSSEKKVWF